MDKKFPSGIFLLLITISACQSVFSGIVSYTTYHGDLGGVEFSPETLSLDYDGLQLKRQFHKPEYARGEQPPNRLPDQRHLLHWEPNITTDKAGRYQLEFYTSDLTGKYIVTVEGLTDEGFSGSSTYTFEVHKADNR